MSIAIELVQGTARDFPFQVTNPDGTTPTGIFLATGRPDRQRLGGVERGPAADPDHDLDLGHECAVSGHAPGHRQQLPGLTGSTICKRTPRGPARRPHDGSLAAGHVAGDHRRARGRTRPGRPTSPSWICGRSPPGSTTCRSPTPTRVRRPLRRRAGLARRDDPAELPRRQRQRSWATTGSRWTPGTPAAAGAPA